MVLLDKRSDILDELQAIIIAGINDLNKVHPKPMTSDQLPASDYPAIDMEVGPSSVVRELTSTIDQVFSLVLRIYTKGDDDGDQGYDIYDTLVSLIETNPTLNDTCISALGQGGDMPRVHLGSFTATTMDYQLAITYRRDIV